MTAAPAAAIRLSLTFGLIGFYSDVKGDKISPWITDAVPKRQQESRNFPQHDSLDQVPHL